MSKRVETDLKFANNHGIADSNGNVVLGVNAVADSVNKLVVQGGATGVAPKLTAGGVDENIDIKLEPKGTGQVKIGSNSVSLSNHSHDSTYILLSEKGAANGVATLDSNGKLAQIYPNDFLAGGYCGTPLAGMTIPAYYHVASNNLTIYASFLGSGFICLTPPSGGNVTFTVYKNTSSVGTITFANTTGTPSVVCASDFTLIAGDYLKLVAPSNLYNIANIMWTFKGAWA